MDTSNPLKDGKAKHYENPRFGFGNYIQILSSWIYPRSFQLEQVGQRA